MKFNLKHRALFANIIYPGAGYFVMKKWIRGSVMLLLTIFSLIALLVMFAQMIIGAYYQVQNDKEFSFDYIYLLLPFSFFFLLWIFSYIDLIFICSTSERADD